MNDDYIQLLLAAYTLTTEPVGSRKHLKAMQYVDNLYDEIIGVDDGKITGKPLWFDGSGGNDGEDSAEL